MIERPANKYTADHRSKRRDLSLLVIGLVLGLLSGLLIPSWIPAPTEEPESPDEVGLGHIIWRIEENPRFFHLECKPGTSEIQSIERYLDHWTIVFIAQCRRIGTWLPEGLDPPFERLVVTLLWDAETRSLLSISTTEED